MKTIKINIEDNDVIDGIVTFIQSKYKYAWSGDTIINFNKSKKLGKVTFPKIEEEKGEVVIIYDDSFNKELSIKMDKLKEDITTEDIKASVFINFQSVKTDYMKLNKNKECFGELNNFFKRYKIGKVGFCKDITNNYQEYCAKELSLVFYPYNSSGNSLNFDNNVLNPYKELTNTGNIPHGGEVINKMSDEKEDIVKLNGLEIGRYYRDRNLILIWVNPFYNSELKNKPSYTDDKFLNKFLPDLMKAITALKPTKEKIDDFTIRLIVDSFKKEQKKLSVNAKRKLIEVESSIKNYEKELGTYYETRIVQMGLLDSINIPTKDIILEEIKKLKENKLLEKVELKDGGIIITFKETSIRCLMDRNVDMGDGRFGVVDMYLGRISFKLNGSNNLTVTSDVPSSDSYPHPHANNDGRPCLGDGPGKLQIMKLLGERKLDALAYQLWMWIKTYRSSSAYVKVYNWYDDRLKQGYPVFDAKGKRIELNDPKRIASGEQNKLTKTKNHKDNFEKTKDFKPGA